jgi:hypothetical protein
MSKVFIEEETLLGIGNAIRDKNGTTDLIATTDMAQTILDLPTGGPAETIKINSIARASSTSFNVGQYVGDATDFILFFTHTTSTSTTGSYGRLVYRNGNVGSLLSSSATNAGVNTFITTSYSATNAVSMKVSSPTATLSNGILTVDRGQVGNYGVLIYRGEA